MGKPRSSFSESALQFTRARLAHTTSVTISPSLSPLLSLSFKSFHPDFSPWPFCKGSSLWFRSALLGRSVFRSSRFDSSPGCGPLQCRPLPQPRESLAWLCYLEAAQQGDESALALGPGAAGSLALGAQGPLHLPLPLVRGRRRWPVEAPLRQGGPHLHHEQPGEGPLHDVLLRTLAHGGVCTSLHHL